MIKLLSDYASRNNIILNVKENDIKEASKMNKDIKKILENYKNSKDNNKIQRYLKENGYSDTEKDINDFFLNCIYYNKTELTKLTIDYANRKMVLLNINAYDHNKRYPLLWSTMINNFEMTQLIINYANSNKINLKINEVDINENYPFLICIMNNNIEMAQLIIDYAIKNNIKLTVNGKNKNGDHPLLISIKKNNTKMAKLIVDYANKNNIILNTEDISKVPKVDKDIKEILENYKYSINENGESNSQINNSKSNNYYINNCSINENHNSPGEKSENNLNINNENFQFVVAEYDFVSRKERELNFKKGDKIKIINWNFKEEWAYGCKSDDLSKMGVFPKPLVMFENKNNKGNENNDTSGLSSNHQKIESNKFSNEKSSKPFVYQSNPSIILNQQPNYQLNPQFISMSNLSYPETIYATVPDETVLQYASVPIEPYVQPSVQLYPTAPNEIPFQTSPNQQYIINSNPPYIQQISQPNPQNYVNSYFIPQVYSTYSTTEYYTDEPPPSYESIMKE